MTTDVERSSFSAMSSSLALKADVHRTVIVSSLSGPSFGLRPTAFFFAIVAVAIVPTPRFTGGNYQDVRRNPTAMSIITAESHGKR
jgi:hypothetical protein